MIAALVSPFVTHFRVRAEAVVRSPSALISLFFFAAISVYLWPGCGDATLAPAGFDDSTAERVLVWTMWLYLWPMVPALAARGRASGVAGGVSGLAVPAVPVGPLVRAAAEVTLVLAVTVVVRIAILMTVSDISPQSIVSESLVGAMLMVPMVLSWALPGACLEVFMARSLPPALVLVVSGLAGWWSNPAGLVAAVVVTTMLVVLLRRFAGFGRLSDLVSPRLGSLSRPAVADPALRLRADAWRAPLRPWGWWLAAALVLYVVSIALEVNGLGLSWGHFVAFEIFIMLAIQPLLRPLGSALAIEGMVGKKGAQRGDFLRAWSVLPVSQRAILRRVWQHGLLYGALLWLVPVLMLLARTWLMRGELGLLASDGDDLSGMILPAVAVVPMLAGFLLASAAGARALSNVAGLGLVLGIHGFFLVRILLGSTFGRGSTVESVGCIVFVVLLAAVTSLPPLRLLGEA